MYEKTLNIGRSLALLKNLTSINETLRHTAGLKEAE
jgi:hypothetical protein